LQHPPPPAGFSRSSLRSSHAPLSSASAGRGAHRAGRSLPLPRDPATAGVTSQPGKKLQRWLPRLSRFADAISRLAHNSKRRRATSVAFPGTANPAPTVANQKASLRRGRGHSGVAHGAGRVPGGQRSLQPHPGIPVGEGTGGSLRICFFFRGKCLNGVRGFTSARVICVCLCDILFASF
jgi:hypothetical protein